MNKDRPRRQVVALTAILVAGCILLAHSRRRQSLLELAAEVRLLQGLPQRVPALTQRLGR